MRRLFYQMVWLLFFILAAGLTIYSLIDTQDSRDDVYRVDEDELPDELHPTVENKKNQLLEDASEIGIDVVITDGIRTIEEQEEIYERGRTKEGQIVTYAEGGESYHNYGLAVDFALRTEEGRISWNTEADRNDNGEADWVEVAELAKDLGFEWGGDWESFQDYPHLQMDFGLSIRELQNGKRPEAEPPEEE
ncbi:M15 family metallopeptidase [Halobacillus sp. Marseille-P3879]|uniref:M15 family metallopeptidase n=1 Tax=Halobacillus sp. Marseille-P3879 TaxID=2045014 RepID=UPI001F1DDD73|nr:M15 family metallopeptidase [Halobacillus sp. Marseille-P3879]